MTSDKGFSLVETLIAILVVVLSGVGTLKLYSYLEVEKANALMFVEAKQLLENQIALIHTVNTIDGACKDKTFEDIQSCHLGDTAPFVVEVTQATPIEYENESGEEVPFAVVLEYQATWIDRNGIEQNLILPVSVSKFTNLLD
ncbi:hypothetical protein GCE9029_04958 [Grimontia celer]|uniref:Prepilin-type N-terminal cleavage/methylation domain-containing protein n=1 Tax=Grimontia celer TaxID=1796497 RepID=A0A128FG86_9GAMM|nr:hypothetical protein [Grimontia celer]CZF85354.1 hypothetical protein GCE9029_04958 [Grimontia celer]